MVIDGARLVSSPELPVEFPTLTDTRSTGTCAAKSVMTEGFSLWMAAECPAPPIRTTARAARSSPQAGQDRPAVEVAPQGLTQLQRGELPTATAQFDTSGDGAYARPAGVGGEQLGGLG